MKKSRINIILLHSVLWILVLLTVYPIFYLFVTSLKSNAQIYSQFWAIFPSPVHWENYVIAWKAINIYMFNTFYVAVLSVGGTLFLASLSAYVFARFDFKFKELLFYSILILLMIPGVLTLIPSFKLIVALKLFNSHLALILPYIAGGQVFMIFVLRGFFANIPQTYFDAARIDGASEFKVYWNIALPLSKPILATMAIMQTMGVWGDYIWPMVAISSQKLRTISIGLMYFRSEYHVYQGHLMAGNVIASLPIIFLFLFTMKLFIKGITTGGLRA